MQGLWLRNVVWIHTVRSHPVLCFRYTCWHLITENLTTYTLKVIQWAIEIANDPAYHIILVAQSLGTALACAAASHSIGIQLKPSQPPDKACSV